MLGGPLKDLKYKDLFSTNIVLDEECLEPYLSTSIIFNKHFCQYLGVLFVTPKECDKTVCPFLGLFL